MGAERMLHPTRYMQYTFSWPTLASRMLPHRAQPLGQDCTRCWGGG